MPDWLNRHLRADERDLPLPERLKRAHWQRVIYNTTPILWTLSFIWWIPGLRWLWRLRCRNVTWRIERHRRRATANLPDLHTWSRM